MSKKTIWQFVVRSHDVQLSAAWFFDGDTGLTRNYHYEIYKFGDRLCERLG